MFKTSYIPQFILLFCLAACISGCDYNLNFSCDDFESEVVIYSLFTPGDTWNIEVSKSKCRFDEEDSNLLENADVKVFNVTGSTTYPIKVTPEGNGIYRVAQKPISGNQYRILVTAIIDDETIYSDAISTVPEIPDPKVNVLEKENNEGHTFMEVDFSLQKVDTEENYYIINFIETIQDEEVEEGTEIEIDTLGQGGGSTGGSSFLDPGIDFRGDEFEIFIGNGEFSDEGKYTKKYTTRPYNTASEQDVNLKFVLVVQSVAKDVFEYKKTLYDYKNGNFSGSNLADPLEVHSNIGNGLGIFGAYNQTSHIITP